MIDNYIPDIQGLSTRYKQLKHRYGWTYVSPYRSLGVLPRVAKGYLCADKYVDIDIVNCHPNILIQLCKNLNNQGSSIIDPELINELEYYVDNRADILDNTMSTFGVSKDDAKTLLIWLIYGGKFSAWAKDTENYTDVDLWNCSEKSRQLITFIDKF